MVPKNKMDWTQYKSDVASSRKLIVFPFFETHLSTESGVALDIGCGDGDLTSRVAALTSAKIIGIDCDAAGIAQARQAANVNTHFVEGDVEKDAIPALGMTFDFAFSNCCLPHLSDEGIYRLIAELHWCMRNGSKLIILVPSISWARAMYESVQYVGTGITALPRYGDRQTFRIPEWYIAALESCGFELIRHEEINIPDDDALDERYRNKVGCPLFSAFVAKRIDRIPNRYLLQKRFRVAQENRRLEIQLFWQRSLFFWGFVASALVGYGTTYRASPNVALAFGLFGFVCSVVWAAGNRGSKYWQEYWENKVTVLQHYTVGNIFFDRTPKTPNTFDHFAARRLSVSKLTIALSDYTVVLWLILCAHSLVRRFYSIPDQWLTWCSVIFAISTAVYCAYFLNHSNSED